MSSDPRNRTLYLAHFNLRSATETKAYTRLVWVPKNVKVAQVLHSYFQARSSERVWISNLSFSEAISNDDDDP